MEMVRYLVRDVAIIQHLDGIQVRQPGRKAETQHLTGY